MKTIDVVAAVIERDGKVLATQRGYGDMAGGWEFPGGRIEPGESPEQALVREIREELAVDIAVERHLITVDHDYETFHLHMFCYLAHLTSGEPHLLEHTAATWLDAESLAAIDWLPADRAAVRAVTSALPMPGKVRHLCP